MKKTYLLFSLVCLIINVNAQWEPFPLEQKSFFKYPKPFFTQDTTINIYFHDSIVNHGTHQVLHFDYSTPDFDGCYETVNHTPNLYTRYNDQIRPDSIIKTNDSLLFAFSYKHYQPFSTDSILFLPNIQKDSSWFSDINNGNTNYNSLKFTCDSIYLDAITGNLTDSVKLISIRTYNNLTPVNSSLDSLQVILSKNYGIKQWISFYSHIKNEIPLIGLDSGTIKEGFQLPSFSDYFHLSVGDIIIWKEHTTDSDIMIPDETRYYKDSITNVSSFPDSVFYTIERTLDSGTKTITHRNYYKNRFKGLDLSTSIFLNGQSASGYWSYDYYSLIESSPIQITNDTIINREFKYESCSIVSSDCSANCVPDNGNTTAYNTYYGFTSFHSFNFGTYDLTIEGSIIDGIQIGNVWNVSVDEITIDNSFSIYPNPSNNGLFYLFGENIEYVNIINSQGVLIKTVKIVDTETSINFENQAKGIYFVKSKFKNGSVVTKKLLIIS